MMNDREYSIVDYFAYGSNMHKEQILSRCPSVTMVSVACLKGFQLNFPRKSITRQCGAASICETEGSEVWGVIFRLTLDDVLKLDKFEGVSSGSYRKVEMNVHNVITGQTHFIFTYIANPQKGVFKPNKNYLDTIIAGVETYPEIPNTYKDFIRKIQVMDE